MFQAEGLTSSRSPNTNPPPPDCSYTQSSSRLPKFPLSHSHHARAVSRRPFFYHLAFPGRHVNSSDQQGFPVGTLVGKDRLPIRGPTHHHICRLQSRNLFSTLPTTDRPQESLPIRRSPGYESLAIRRDHVLGRGIFLASVHAASSVDRLPRVLPVRTVSGAPRRAKANAGNTFTATSHPNRADGLNNFVVA